MSMIINGHKKPAISDNYWQDSYSRIIGRNQAPVEVRGTAITSINLMPADIKFVHILG
jgi:hypothetical protein